MKNFNQFVDIVKTPEFEKYISEYITSRKRNLPISNFFDEKDVNDIASFIASTSADIALFLLKYYHNWVNSIDN